MSKLNLFWPIYKNLEKEFLKLADYIHFSDKQLKVYSMHIADLIVRCAIEIEALSKELYYELGGNISTGDLHFDTDCINLLEQEWKLSQKQITVSAANFYFSDDNNKILTPLNKANKRGTSGSRWKQAYQAIKHDRKNSLEKANIENLLHAMGTLYILNLYFKSKPLDLGFANMNTQSFDNRAESDIFSVFCYDATLIRPSNFMSDKSIEQIPDNILERSIYIVKYDENSFNSIHIAFHSGNYSLLQSNRKEVILNKSNKIYPELSFFPRSR